MDIAASTNSPSGSGTVLSTRMILSRTFVPTGSRCALVSCARDEAAAIAIAAKSATATVFFIRTSRIGSYMQSALRLARAAVNVERRGSAIYLRSPQKLGPYARCITEWLSMWSDKAPEPLFLAERKGDDWRKLGYREAYGAVRRIGQALLERGLNAERPVAILSDNSIDHALLALGAMHVGIPAAPISPAYSLMSQDHR